MRQHAVAFFTLAVAIGATTAIFSAVDAVLLHPLPYPDPDRLVVIQENLPRVRLKNIAPSPADFATYRRESAAFSTIAGAMGTIATLTGDGIPEDLEALKITADTFPMLGVTPIVGGLFNAENEKPGQDHVALISESLWTRRFGRDPSIVGRDIHINRDAYRVVGVVHPVLDFERAAEIWMPLAFDPKEIQPGVNGPHYINAIARLKPGVSIDQASAQIRSIAQGIARQYPVQAAQDPNFSAGVIPLATRQAGNIRTPLLVLIAAVGALMLIACANVSNLLLARGMHRRREFGIRSALGASRARIVGQLLKESLLLALSAGAAGTLLAYYALHLYTRFAPKELIHGTQPSLNLWVIAFSIALSAAASIVFGLAPALETSRIDLAEILKDSSRGATTSRRILRESMVALEIALSLVLLIGAGLVVESFIHIVRTSTGFNPDHVLTASTTLPEAAYAKPSDRIAFTRSLLDRVRALPGVHSAAITDFLPYWGGPGSMIQIPGHPRAPGEPTSVVYQTRATPGYFETMRIPILRGRDLEPSDEQGTPPAAVIDESTAHRFFPDRDPLGNQVTLPFTQTDYTIVGIVRDTKTINPDAAPLLRAYYIGPKFPFTSVTLEVRAERDPSTLISTLRREISALDPNLPVEIQTMDEIMAISVSRQRFSIELMSALSIIAAFLAAIGIYGVLAYLVDQRRREFGIRIALGARSSDVLALVLRQGSIPIAAGLIAGIAAALALTRLLKSLLYETTPTDPQIFLTITIALTTIAIAAMLIPAHRATQVDPLKSLHHE
jgi:putative ABC transport system permease protein